MLAASMFLGVGCRTKQDAEQHSDSGAMIKETDTVAKANSPEEIDTRRYDANLKAAEIAVQEGDWRLAAKAYQRAIEANPNEWELYMDLAIAQSKIPQFLNAIDSIEQAIDRGGAEDWRTYYNLGNIYQNRGMYAESIEAYRVARTYQDKPHVPTLLNISSGYIFLRRYEEAKETLDYIASISPREVRVYHNLALIDHLQRKYEVALQGYEQALSLDPSFAQSHYNRGDVLINLKRYDEAAAAYGEYTRLEPEGPYIKRARNKIRYCNEQR
jgi:tetratricopeptide (TPR) repeat protein